MYICTICVYTCTFKLYCFLLYISISFFLNRGLKMGLAREKIIVWRSGYKPWGSWRLKQNWVRKLQRAGVGLRTFEPQAIGGICFKSGFVGVCELVARNKKLRGTCAQLRAAELLSMARQHWSLFVVNQYSEYFLIILFCL